MIMSMYKKICITNRQLVCKQFNISNYNSEEAFDKLLLQIEKVCKSRADSIILREKDLEEAVYEVLAKQAIAICKRYEVRLLLHTYVEVAKRLMHPHIHVPYAVFCDMLGDDTISFDGRNKTFAFRTVGVSTHTQEEVCFAGEHGASYVTLSPIYETTCKPGKKAKGLGFLEKIAHNTTIPVYALGGINEDRMDACIFHGASGVCMMSEYMRQ